MILGEVKSNLPWVEKYRPAKLDELVSHDDIIKTISKFMKEDQLPHLLFYGPPGTGKTSTILACARQMYTPQQFNSMVLELNASDDRGIGIVRGQILNFASTRTIFKAGFKLVILDEADAMTNDAQNALRRSWCPWQPATTNTARPAFPINIPLNGQSIAADNGMEICGQYGFMSMLCARYLGLQWGGLTQGADVLLGECPPTRPARPPVPLKLCDVAGTGRDSPMLANYIYASHIILLVYDITNLQSFERLGLWLESVSDILAGSEPVPLLAVFGNKSDLEHQRAVRLGCVNDFATEFGCLNFSGSARTGENVNATIISLVSHVLGVPINKSHLVNSSILKAELAPHSRPLRNIPNNTQLINAKIKETDKNTNENNKMFHGKQKSKRIKKDTIKHNKKVMKELKWKATSAVFIEKYTENVRFCIICNYLSKIIPALQSRCTRFRFAPLQPSQIVPRVEHVIKQEGLKVSDDGLKALLTLSGGDMRKVLNTLQSTWMAYKDVTEDNVYTCVGHPLRNDISSIVNWLLNEDDFALCNKKIRDLKNAKGLALGDILTEIHHVIQRTELPSSVLITLLMKMSDMEMYLSTGCNENIQLASLIAAFQIARDLVRPEDNE